MDDTLLTQGPPIAAPQTERRWLLAGFALLLCCTIARLWYIATSRVMADEAYYYVWTHHLAGGYIDGGPTIAYVNWLFTTLLGPSDFSVRLGAVVGITGATLFLLLWGARRFGTRTGFILAALGSLTPVCFISSIVHTYDTEMACCMLVAIALYYDAFFVDARRFPLAGVWLGLALLSKISVIFSALAIFVFPFCRRDTRPITRQWAFYLSFLIAALVFSPFIYWNLTHDLAFIRFKGGMAFRSGDFSDFVDVWGAQVGMFLPIVFWLAVSLPFRTVVDSLRKRPIPPHWLYFALTSVFAFGYFVPGSLFSRYYANWVIPAFFGGLFLTALLFGTQWPKYRPWLAAHLVLSVLMLTVSIGQQYGDWLPLSPRADITTPYFLFAAIPGELRDYLHAHPELQQVRLAGNDYQVPSMINLYLQPSIEATGLSLNGYHNTLYTMLYPPRTLAGARLLFLVPEEKDGAFLPGFRAHFATARKLRTFTSLRHGKVVNRLTLWDTTGYDGLQ